MKKIFLISTIIVLLVGIMNAQTATTQSPEVRAKSAVAKINKNCTLVGDQTTKVNKIYIDYFTKQEALNAKKAGMDAKEFDKQMAVVVGERNAGLKKVLTPEQGKMMEAVHKQKEMKAGGAAAPKQ